MDRLDDLDAHGRIYMRFRSAGGRKVASSNLAAPTTRKPASEAGQSGTIIRLEDGRVAEHWGVTDTMSLMQQIGAIPG